MAPGTCARVAAICLEELGLIFKTQVIRFMKGEHKSPSYLAINPKGKVPTLSINDRVLTENVAILQYLNEANNGALLPSLETPEAKAEVLADLCFCSATLHPLVTRIRMPQLIGGQSSAVDVKTLAFKAMDEQFSLIEERLSKNEWWYRDTWTALDAYLYWVFWRVEGADYDVSRFPAYSAHARKMAERPATIRAIAHEEEAQAQLASEGLVFTPPKVDVKPL
jgi:glutathione S-transferase